LIRPLYINGTFHRNLDLHPIKKVMEWKSRNWFIVALGDPLLLIFAFCLM